MNYDELRRLAEAATPGPWGKPSTALLRTDIAMVGKGPKGGGRAIAGCYRNHANAAYIAAASPDVILALLDERERLLAALERIAFWEGAPSAPHEGFDFDSHTDCSVEEGCPAMVAREALPPGWSTANPEGVES